MFSYGMPAINIHQTGETVIEIFFLFVYTLSSMQHVAGNILLALVASIF